MSFKKIFTVIAIIILIIILRNTIISINDLVQNDGTVQDLRLDLTKKRKENEFLTQRLSYVKTDEFVEQEAREKLGLVRKNEYPVFVTPPSDIQQDSQEEEKENWRKWKEVFHL